jgi:glycosyltransferase involved in cell wall biosynthesis
LKIAAILPAYNEAARIADVLCAVKKLLYIDEIIVVNDGSTDATVKVVRDISGVRLINLEVNRGKGGAMMAGVKATNADVLVFLDADLIGLKPEHVESLIAPVRLGKVKMAVGMFRGGRKLTDWSQKLVPNISGQRAIRRDVFEQIPDLDQSRYGVEMAITRFCHHYRVPYETVLLPGVTHPMKEEKLGFLRGCISRGKMYYEICKIICNPRAPHRVRRTRTTLPKILRRFAANDRRTGHSDGAYLWLYKKKRNWQRKKASRRKWH